MKLIDFNSGKQKADIMKSGNIFPDSNGNAIFRQFDYIWNKKKKKKMQSRVPFIMSRKLRRTPYECDRTLMLQTDLCNLKCWFCFVDDKNKDGTCGIKKNLYKVAEDAHEVIKALNEFDEIMSTGKPVKFVRISGGEPMLDLDTPWLVQDLHARGIGVWLDTNLMAGINNYMRLTPLKNFGMSLCLKGIDPDSAHMNSGRDIFDIQLKSLDYIYNTCQITDITLYVINNIYNVRQIDIFDFYTTLEEINPDLPKKVEWLKLEIYKPTEARLNGRKPPLFPHEKTEALWSKLLKNETGHDYLYHLMMS